MTTKTQAVPGPGPRGELLAGSESSQLRIDVSDDERRGPVPARVPASVKRDLLQALTTLRRQGLRNDTEGRIETFFVVADAFEADGQLVHAVDCLEDLLSRLRQVIAARSGGSDAGWLFVSEDDLLAYRDSHNLHAVDDRYLTGAQPTATGYRWLKEKGVDTVVSLRLEAAADRATVEGVGLRFVHLAWPDEEAPGIEQVEALLATVRGASGKVFQHCLRGIGRDLTMACCYELATGRASADELIERSQASAPRWAGDQVRTAGGEPAQFAFLREIERVLAR